MQFINLRESASVLRGGNQRQAQRSPCGSHLDPVSWFSFTPLPPTLLAILVLTSFTLFQPHTSAFPHLCLFTSRERPWRLIAFFPLACHPLEMCQCLQGKSVAHSGALRSFARCLWRLLFSLNSTLHPKDSTGDGLSSPPYLTHPLVCPKPQWAEPGRLSHFGIETHLCQTCHNFL